MIHEEIVTYEVAKLAKGKGFDWGCLYHYDSDGALKEHYSYDAYNSGVSVSDLLWNRAGDDEYLAPTQIQLQRWLREVKNVQIIIKPTLDNLGAWVWGRYSWVIFIFNKRRPMYYSIYHGDNSSYELALADALKYALENLCNLQNNEE